MRMFVHVICEERDGHWSAWFSGRPELASGGLWPSQAIQRLLDGFGGQYSSEEIVALDSRTRDGHLEFLVPEVFRLKIPTPSVN